MGVNQAWSDSPAVKVNNLGHRPDEALNVGFAPNCYDDSILDGNGVQYTLTVIHSNNWSILKN